MIEILSLQEPISKNKDEADEVFAVATSLIFCYGTAWNLLFWTVGISTWYETDGGDRYRDDSTDTESEEENSNSLWSPRMREIGKNLAGLARNPINISLFFGVLIGLCGPIKTLLIKPEGYLSFIGSAMRTVGAPSVGLTAISTYRSDCDVLRVRENA